MKHAVWSLRVVLLLAVAAICLPYQSRAASVDSTAAMAPAPVVFRGDTITVVRAPMGPFSPADRAKASLERVERLLKDRGTHMDSLVVRDLGHSSSVYSGDRIVFTITDEDAALEGTTRHEFAHRLAAQVYTLLMRDAQRTSFRSLLIAGALSLLCTIALIVVFVFLKRLFRRAVAVLHSWRDTRIRPLRIQNVEVFSAARITNLFIGAVKIVRAVTYVLLFYLFVPLILSFFPWTRGLSTKLINYILSPLGSVAMAIVNYLPNVLFIAIIAVVTRYVLRMIEWFFQEIEKGTIRLPEFYPDWSMPTFRILRVFVFAFAMVVIFPYLPGASSPAFKGVSVFVGLLLSLGSAASISNMVAGVVLIYMRAFNVGDRVRIADTTGEVIEKTLLVTRVRTIKNVSVTVPNALVLGSHIINYSSSAKARGLILHTTVTIGYNAPWKKVHELLLAAADATEHVLKQPKPFVLQTALDDSYVSYEINVYTDQPEFMIMTLSQLHENIQDKFNEGGVEIMSPAYSAIRDGNASTIPDPYLPKSYRAPGFRIFPWTRSGQSSDSGEE